MSYAMATENTANFAADSINDTITTAPPAKRDYKALFNKAADVVKHAALSSAFRAAAVGGVTALGANVYAAAAVGGVTVTTYNAVKDYRTHLKTQEEKNSAWNAFKGFFGFLKDNKKKYAFELAKNTGFSLIGAEVVQHWSAIKDFAGPALDWTKNALGKTANTLMDIVISPAGAEELPKNGIQTASLGHPAQVLDTPTAEAVPTPPAPSFSLDGITGDDTVQKTLKAAQHGKAWALQDLAHYAAHGRHGMGKSLETAHALAEMALKAAGEQDNHKIAKLATRFLHDLDHLSPHHDIAGATAPNTDSVATKGTRVHHVYAPAHPAASASAIPTPAAPAAAPHLQTVYFVDGKTAQCDVAGINKWSNHAIDVARQFKQAAGEKAREAMAILKGRTAWGMDGLTDSSLKSATDNKLCMEYATRDDAFRNISNSPKNPLVISGDSLHAKSPNLDGSIQELRFRIPANTPAFPSTKLCDTSVHARTFCKIAEVHQQFKVLPSNDQIRQIREAVEEHFRAKAALRPRGTTNNLAKFDF